MINLLEDLRKNIKDKMVRNQEDEVNAGIALAEFKLKIEREVKELDRALNKESAKTSKLES